MKMTEIKAGEFYCTYIPILEKNKYVVGGWIMNKLEKIYQNEVKWIQVGYTFA